MGFYSSRGLNRHNLRHGIAEHLYPAVEGLTEQVRRALAYERDAGRDPGREPPDAIARAVVLRLVHRLPELRRVLNTDVLAAFDGDPAARSIEEVVFSYPSIVALTAHRLAHVLWRESVPMIPRILSEHAHALTGIDIHAGATIGERFFIDHGTGVVVGETSVLGRNVKLYQGVTLGALSTRRGTDGCCGGQRHPTLEDGVTVYAGATILGGTTVVGAGSVIGANVWLTHSVPPGSRIAGRGRDGEEAAW
ncbi:MAG: serine acetyltransferase [Polyangiaceae bacterium]|nr:serine acetyltransferase [Polyangiaceae bacterium]